MLLREAWVVLCCFDPTTFATSVSYIPFRILKPCKWFDNKPMLHERCAYFWPSLPRC